MIDIMHPEMNRCLDDLLVGERMRISLGIPKALFRAIRRRLVRRGS
jgi:hypothetical protein